MLDCIWDPHGRDKQIGSSHMRGVPVKIYKATPENCPDGKVVPCAPEDGTEIIYDASDPRLKEWLPDTRSGRRRSAMTQYAIVTDLNPLRGLPSLHGGLQGGEQRAHRVLLE